LEGSREGQIRNNQWDLSNRKEICHKYLCRRFLHKVEGSGNTFFRKLSVDLVSLIKRTEYIWIRGGKLGKVYKEGFMDLKSSLRTQLISSIPVRYQSAFSQFHFTDTAL
jgi:hypothetical protein